MDYQRFIEQLPSLYENWGQESVRPKSDQFQQVFERVQGITTLNVMQLLNFAVECLESDEIYCEIGSHQGATLIAAMLNHPNLVAYAIDNSCKDDLSEEKFDKLIENVSSFNLQDQIYLYNQDLEEFLLELREIDTEDKIGVYFYNGDRDYRSPLLGLLLVKPFLAEKALIIVYDSNWGTVQQAIWDFIAAHPECQALLDFQRLVASYPTCWNNIQILTWDASRSSNYPVSTFRQMRQQPVVQAIYNLHLLEPGDINLEVALESQKNTAQFSLNLGNKFYQQGRYQEATDRYKIFLELQPGDAELYFTLSECFKHLNRVEEAISTLQEGIHWHLTAGKLHFYLITLLQQRGQTQEAIASAEMASQLIPNEYVFNIFKNLMLPPIYNTPDEISFYRQRFIQGLQNLIRQTSLETPEDQKNALAGIGCITNFYLAYQGHNDIELQGQYGNLVHQIMAANYPQWVKPLPIPQLKNNKKIRIGYASTFLHSWSGTFLSTGYLRHRDKQSFEVYCYYTGNEPDEITQLFQAYSDVFHHIPNNLEAVSEQIIADQLHILVFPELGMHPLTMQIASLRLAPLQCVVWGHPVTSGLPTIDYFLSSDLMEPENAQEHYTETLIRLPNIGVAYPKLAIPQLTKTRSDFQLRDDAVVYLSCQAPYKYLPQHDYIFAEIARRVPQAQFMFLRAGVPQERLQRAFAAVGLKSTDYCVFSPVLPRPDYLMLNLFSDIYLDTLSWSGGNTTLDAIACNLPIVTCPGEFMRGRHSYGMLKRLGVTATIAQNEAEYIEIAVKLGLSPEWRLDIREQIKGCHDCLYDDTACVEALETFYKQVVQEKLIQI